jgi:hypothetical protein
MESEGAGVAVPIAGLLERSNSLDRRNILLAALLLEQQQTEQAIRNLERFDPLSTGATGAGAQSAIEGRKARAREEDTIQYGVCRPVEVRRRTEVAFRQQGESD